MLSQGRIRAHLPTSFNLTNTARLHGRFEYRRTHWEIIEDIICSAVSSSKFEYMVYCQRSFDGPWTRMIHVVYTLQDSLILKLVLSFPFKHSLDSVAKQSEFNHRNTVREVV